MTRGGRHVIELASVIRDLRDELEQAVVVGQDRALRFELGPIELEVAVAIERSGGASGKVRFFVLELGTDGKTAATTTQRIKLSLAPRLAGTGATPYISGQALPGEE